MRSGTELSQFLRVFPPTLAAGARPRLSDFFLVFSIPDLFIPYFLFFSFFLSLSLWVTARYRFKFSKSR